MLSHRFSYNQVSDGYTVICLLILASYYYPGTEFAFAIGESSFLAFAPIILNQFNIALRGTQRSWRPARLDKKLESHHDKLNHITLLYSFCIAMVVWILIPPATTAVMYAAVGILVPFISLACTYGVLRIIHAIKLAQHKKQTA